MGNKLRYSVVLVTLFIVVVMFSPAVSSFHTNSQTDILLVSIERESDLSNIKSLGGDVLARYPDRALIRMPTRTENQLRSAGITIASTLPSRTELSVKGHTFDINENMPNFPESLTIDGYRPGEQGIYLVHMLGPVSSEWRTSLESESVDIINYVPNYAYEVRMTPELAERVENFDFVDWVGIYHPGFKLPQNIEPGYVMVNMVDGRRLVTEVDDRSQLVEIANDNNVYYLSQYHEPKLLDEMATQIIGGGLWVLDDDDNPDTAYRKHGEYGSFANQIGYHGSEYVTTIADSGLGNGTTPDAGHPDFKDRVVGGYDYQSESFEEGEWNDGNGHGTHCAGSIGGNTYNGTGTLYYEDYYASQGSAPSTKFFAVKVFSDSGNWIGPTDYHHIVEVAMQNTNTYFHSNSWGGEGDGAYTYSDEDYDRSVRDGNRDSDENEPIIITTAAGNSGPGTDGGGYNSISSPGNAKNVITVGSVQNYNPNVGVYDPEAVSSFSSRGWTDDNRVKPDLMAPGEGIRSTGPDGNYLTKSGTSMATPAVTGAASVVVDWYESTYGTRPNPSMVKALMINNAYDLANTQADTGENSPYIPSQDQGWGMVNLPTIVDAPVNMLLEDETSLLQTGQIDEYEIEYEDSSVPLNITLTWTDDNAMAGDDPTLKNDLNLELISPSGFVFRGNNLVESWSEPGESTYSTFDTNGDGWDNVNNVENINLHTDLMETGTYTVRVIGHNIPSDANNDGLPNQDYSLVMYNAVESPTEHKPFPPTDPDPSDGATGIPTEIELSVYAEHEVDDDMDVYFYDASDDSLIGTDSDVTSGSRAYTSWDGLDNDNTYQWYTVADDGSQTSISDTWSFTTEIENFTLTINSSEGGQVTEPGESIYEYNSGEVVYLEAVPENDYLFLEWIGANETIEDTKDNQTHITINSDYSIKAEFEAIEVSEVFIHPDDNQTLEAGEELEFGAEAYDQYGNMITDDLDDFQWQNADSGVFYEVATGGYDVSATYDGVKSNTIYVTVEPSEAVGIDISPDPTNIIAGDSQEYIATAFDKWGNEFDVTENIVWSDDVEPSEGSQWEKNIIAVEVAGKWDVTGEYENLTGKILTDAVELIVEHNDVNYVEVFPGEDFFTKAGEEIMFQAKAYDEYDNLITKRQEDFDWINAENGFFYKTIIGEYNVSAVYNGVTSNVTTIFVEPGSVDIVEINPVEDKTVLSGTELNFTAKAYDEYNNLITNDVKDFTWSNISELDNHRNAAVFYEKSKGDYHVKATYENVSSTVARITVTPFSLTIESTTGGYAIEPDEGTSEFEYGTVVDLKAKADDGYHFLRWSGDNTTIDDVAINQTTIKILDNYSIEVQFKINTYTLEISSTTGGTVVEPGEGKFEYEYGTVVNLEALADDGYKFVNWTSSETNGEETMSLLIDGDKEIRANFDEDEERDGISGLLAVLALLGAITAIVIYIIYKRRYSK